MFVDEFGNEVWSKVLDPGVYNITLGKPCEVKEPGFNVIRFPFTVDGLDCETIPGCFHLDKTFIEDGPEEKASCVIKEFVVRKCFRLTSPLKNECFDECIGKKGRVSIIKDRTGKIVVAYFFPNDDMTEEEDEALKSMWEAYLKSNEREAGGKCCADDCGEIK